MWGWILQPMMSGETKNPFQHLSNCGLLIADCGRPNELIRSPESAIHTFQGFERFSSKAQSTIEYAVLVMVVLVVIASGLHLYAKRAIQGRLKATTDTVGEQFSPRYSNYTYTTTSHQYQQRTLEANGQSLTTERHHAITSTSPYVDDFSGRKLTDEPLYE